MKYKEFYRTIYEECGCGQTEAYPLGGFNATKSDFEDPRLQKVEAISTLLEKNTPTNPSKWATAKAAAKRKFKVYPSAYANLWAAKKYKSMGGGWKKGK